MSNLFNRNLWKDRNDQQACAIYLCEMLQHCPWACPISNLCRLLMYLSCRICAMCRNQPKCSIFPTSRPFRYLQMPGSSSFCAACRVFATSDNILCLSDLCMRCPIEPLTQRILGGCAHRTCISSLKLYVNDTHDRYLERSSRTNCLKSEI